MTKDQMNKIDVLRNHGKSYSEIADTLDLSAGSVRTYCSRNGLTNFVIKTRAEGNLKEVDWSADNPQSVHCCEQCGKSIDGLRKNHRFCSYACRMNWWKSHARDVDRKAYYSLICKHCGIEFLSYGNKSRKYCCRECYLVDRYKREKMGGN